MQRMANAIRMTFFPDFIDVSPNPSLNDRWRKCTKEKVIRHIFHTG